MARAFFASVIATSIVAALMYVNVRMGFLPEVDILGDIRAFNARIGLPTTQQAVWATHAIIGIVIFGAAYALLEPIMPGRGFIAGLTFGLITWLAMMMSFMPLAGHAVFAQDLGPIVMIATLALHLVYGAVLGMSYAALNDMET